jgi:PiT family inorganic phosphate transporter
VFGILTLTLVYKGLKNLKLDLSFTSALGIALGVGLVASLVSWRLVALIREEEQPAAAAVPAANGESLLRSLEKATKHLRRVEASAPTRLREEVTGLLEEIERLQLESKQKYEFQTDSREFQQVERLFVFLQILSASFVAFAHGANDVANSIGPASAVISVVRAGGETVAATAPVPAWLLAIGGLGIVIGLATWGWRVMETIGRRITLLSPSRGFTAEFGAATTILLASKLGLPISTTHTLVGAVLGVGLARGISALNLNTIRDIFFSWIITIPAGAGLAIVFFYGLHIFF